MRAQIFVNDDRVLIGVARKRDDPLRECICVYIDRFANNRRMPDWRSRWIESVVIYKYRNNSIALGCIVDCVNCHPKLLTARYILYRVAASPSFVYRIYITNWRFVCLYTCVSRINQRFQFASLGWFNSPRVRARYFFRYVQRSKFRGICIKRRTHRGAV